MSDADATARPEEVRVLLVEDDPADAALVCIHLEGWTHDRFHATVSRTVADALAQLARATVDVVLLDLSLPDSSGIDTLRTLRAACSTPAMVVMTGALDEQISLEAAKHGADAYLKKSEAEPLLLARTLLYAIHRHRAIAALEAERQLSLHHAMHDALTGLPNRVLLDDRADQAMQTALRTGRVVGMLFVDLDHFKEINVGFGHAAGDALLRAVATRLEEATRSSDTVARIGGDEFAVLLTNVRDRRDVERLAQKLLTRISLPVPIDGRTVHPSASIGTAVGPLDGGTAQELIETADASMYRAKRAGRGRVALEARADASDLAPRERDREAAEHAVSGLGPAAAFELSYTPRFDVTTGAVIALEAHVRAIRDGASDVREGRALATLAEQSGTGPDHLARVLADLERELSGSDPARRIGRISLPLAAAQLLREDFAEQLLDLWRERSVTLELVVPDVLFGLRASHGVRTLSRLQGDGLAIAVEHEEGVDLALRGLARLRPDGVRLHRDRLGKLAPSTVEAALVYGLAHTFAHLSIPWTVDGVEDATDAGRLHALGVVIMQGPLFSERVTIDALDRVIEAGCPWRPKK